MFKTAVLLSVFAIGGSVVLNRTFQATKTRIAANERAVLLENLHRLVPPASHDNDLLKESFSIAYPLPVGNTKPLRVYRVIKQSRVIQIVIETVAPNGYSGSIKLLLAVNRDLTLAGVAVIQHKETPGLGDAIEKRKSDWIDQFIGKSLRNPPPALWKVKRDRGRFDQITSATVTSRAVTKSVLHTLQYVVNHQDLFF